VGFTVQTVAGIDQKLKQSEAARSQEHGCESFPAAKSGIHESKKRNGGKLRNAVDKSVEKNIFENFVEEKGGGVDQKHQTEE